MHINSSISSLIKFPQLPMSIGSFSKFFSHYEQRLPVRLLGLLNFSIVFEESVGLGYLANFTLVSRSCKVVRFCCQFNFIGFLLSYYRKLVTPDDAFFSTVRYVYAKFRKTSYSFPKLTQRITIQAAQIFSYNKFHQCLFYSFFTAAPSVYEDSIQCRQAPEQIRLFSGYQKNFCYRIHHFIDSSTRCFQFYIRVSICLLLYSTPSYLLLIFEAWTTIFKTEYVLLKIRLFLIYDNAWYGLGSYPCRRTTICLLHCSFLVYLFGDISCAFIVRILGYELQEFVLFGMWIRAFLSVS